MTTIDDLAAELVQLQAQVDGLAAQLAQLKTQVPDLEALQFSTVIPCWNNGADKISGATWLPVLVADIPQRILSVGLAFAYWNLAASDTSYWPVSLRKGNENGGWSTIATKTTQNTGATAGGGIAKRMAWTFDSAAWGDADLAAGDLLLLCFDAPVGSPAAVDLPVTVTVRYRPL